MIDKSNYQVYQRSKLKEEQSTRSTCINFGEFYFYKVAWYYPKYA